MKCLCRSLDLLNSLVISIPRNFWWAFAVLYAGFLLYVGGTPGSDLPMPSRLPPGSDKVLHFLAYSGLAALIFRAIYPVDPVKPPRPRWGAWLVLLIPATIGAIDEIHQIWVPGRSSEFADFVADALGGVVVLALGLLFRERNRRLVASQRTLIRPSSRG
ncbi:MAG: VanZ family protein [Candidatus Sumerlaeia bacterium]|nr:VanZ family protein [Candidatus Sumerlaeia bacterium]